MKRLLLPIIPILASVVLASCGTAPTISEAPNSSLFQTSWNSGSDADEPAFHVQNVDRNTIAIRQSLRTTFEAPFLYLLFGEDRALLIDTGVEGSDLRTEIDRHISAWAAAHNRAEPELIVMHTHSHRDHRGGDSALANRPNTVIVGLEVDEIQDFFGIEDWPSSIGSIDLGNRVLEIVPTPGHTDDHVVIFDQTIKALFTGDMIYPGRLYFQCEKARVYEASINRLADFTDDNEVRWLLGAHIEMKADPGQTFRQQNTSRRGEHLLEMPTSTIEEIKGALTAQGGKYVVDTFDDFVLFPHPADPTGMSPPNWCLASEGGR